MEERLNLNGIWRYEPLAWTTVQPNGEIVEDRQNLPPAGDMELPMNWQLRGLDSFDGRVRFTRSFEVSEVDPNRRAFLVFRGVDYFADVSLNGQHLGRHAGYFQPFEFEVTDVIRSGENHLQVDVDCPKEAPGDVWPDHKWLIKGILSHWDARPGSWDPATGQEKNSGGIWHDVYLEWRAQSYVASVRAATTLTPGEASNSFFDSANEHTSGLQAIVRVEVEIESTVGGIYPLHVSLGEARVSTTAQVTRGRSRHVIVVHVPEPRLWWPWDLGDPHLYALTVELGAQDRLLSRRQCDFGIREIDLDAHTGQWTVNGRRFFVRGTNVIPTLWLGEYDEAMIARDITLLKAAHINAVRVCVHINRDEFYSACDRAGIVVWQDFALQWAYTTDPRFTSEAVRQAQDMVLHLYNHPSIALWCTQNESSFHNKVILNPVLAQAVAQYDSSRYVRATSEFTEHAYPGWYFGETRDYMALPGAPILTEFGAQALPSAEEVRQMRGGDQWPPDWKGLLYHDMQYDQTFHVARIALGDSLEEFVENSQRYQAELLKFAIENYRRHKYTKIGGLFQFMFMDCWPSITWSVLSYDRVPKAGYFALQQVYQPILVCAEFRRDSVLLGLDAGALNVPFQARCTVVNDRHEALEGCRLTFILRGADGVCVEETIETPTIPSDSVTLVGSITPKLPLTLGVGQCEIELILRQQDNVLSRNVYTLDVVAAASHQMGQA